MRKSLWIIPALFMVAASLAPCARADTVTFTCTGDNDDGSSTPPFYGPCFEAAPTAPNVTFPGPTLEISWYTAANPSPIAITLPGTLLDSQSYSWFASNGMFIIFFNSGANSVSGNANTNLPSGEGISEFGTLTFTPGSVPAPEPRTSTLMLFGMGLLLLAGKRIAQAT